MVLPFRLIAEEMCRFHAVRPLGQEPVPGVWKLLENLVSLIPEGFPVDPDKQKRYSKTCLKRALSKIPQIGNQDQLSLNADQKYCRMLQREHSAILSIFM